MLTPLHTFSYESLLGFNGVWVRRLCFHGSVTPEDVTTVSGLPVGPTTWDNTCGSRLRTNMVDIWDHCG